ncbi:MAG: EAL domain-containing protein, partial [Heyndrickxia sp.]
ENDFKLFYQPKVDLGTGKIKGVEALIRWFHKEKGIIPPIDFIPIAEESDLILSIGEWVIRTACEQIKEWQEAGFPPMIMAVNLSARQLYQPNLMENIRKILTDTRIDPNCLEIELTESMMMDVDHVLPILQQMKEIGIKISLDDFGMGYSSLYFLKEFPIDKIKIDRSFVQKCTKEAKDATIVKTIIAMAHQLNIEVIAEGIETKEQLIFLQQNLCNRGQGYLFNKPLPPEELVEKFHHIEQVVKREGIERSTSNQKWLENALKMDLLELRNTIRHQKGMIFKFIEIDGKFIHTMCDGELLYRMNTSPEQIVGKEVYDFLPASDAKSKEEFYRRAWNGEEVMYEGCLNGIWYLASLRPIKNAGRIVEVIGSAVDITDRKRIEAVQVSILENEERYRLLLEHSSRAHIIHQEGNILFANPAALKILKESNLIGKSIYNYLVDDSLEKFKQHFLEINSGKRTQRIELRMKRTDGEVIDIVMGGVSTQFHSSPASFIVFGDVSLRKKAEQGLKENEEKYRLIAENMKDLVCKINQEGYFLYASPSHVTVLGYPSEAYEGHRARTCMHKEDFPPVREKLDRIIQTKEGSVFEYRLKDTSGNWIWLEGNATPVFHENGEFDHFLVVSREISERKEYEEKLTYMAYHDSLTGLPNRRSFNEQLEKTMNDAKANNRKFAVVYLDMDNFKMINDTFGHDVGDKVLKQFSKRVKKGIRDIDMVARLAGDEFTILIPDIISDQVAFQIVNNIFISLQDPWYLEGRAIHLEASIGIAFYPVDGKTKFDLLRYADRALYQAKKAGKNNIKCYSSQ